MAVRTPIISMHRRRALILGRRLSRGYKTELVTNNPAFKRSVITESEIHAINEIIRQNRKINIDKWYKSLKSISHSGAVRILPFNGKEVIVKFTQGREAHGDYKGPNLRNHPIRVFMKAHQERVRKIPVAKRKFVLRTPRILSREQDFLIIEHIPEYVPANRYESELIRDVRIEIRNEMQTTFQKLTGQQFDLKMNTIPQPTDIWCSGIFKGKPVFYVPYDYV